MDPKSNSIGSEKKYPASMMSKDGLVTVPLDPQFDSSHSYSGLVNQLKTEAKELDAREEKLVKREIEVEKEERQVAQMSKKSPPSQYPPPPVSGPGGIPVRANALTSEGQYIYVDDEDDGLVPRHLAAESKANSQPYPADSGPSFDGERFDQDEQMRKMLIEQHEKKKMMSSSDFGSLTQPPPKTLEPKLQRHSAPAKSQHNGTLFGQGLISSTPAATAPVSASRYGKDAAFTNKYMPSALVTQGQSTPVLRRPHKSRKEAGSLAQKAADNNDAEAEIEKKVAGIIGKPTSKTQKPALYLYAQILGSLAKIANGAHSFRPTPGAGQSLGAALPSAPAVPGPRSWASLAKAANSIGTSATSSSAAFTTPLSIAPSASTSTSTGPANNAATQWSTLTANPSNIFNTADIKSRPARGDRSAPLGYDDESSGNEYMAYLEEQVGKKAMSLTSRPIAPHAGRRLRVRPTRRTGMLDGDAQERAAGAEKVKPIEDVAGGVTVKDDSSSGEDSESDDEKPTLIIDGEDGEFERSLEALRAYKLKKKDAKRM